MNSILETIKEFFHGQDTISINIPLLITVVIILLAALAICIYITKKNNLYIRTKQNSNPINIKLQDEVA